jgi:hypothetical protein
VSLRGLVAVILAAGVAATLIILAVDTARQNGHVTDAEANLLWTLTGAVIGGVAVYLGGRDRNGHDRQNGP